MLIGGMANIVWGKPRATLDVDVMVWVEEPQIAGFVDAIRDDFGVLVDQPIALIDETRALPIESRPTTSVTTHALRRTHRTRGRW